ncbi:thiolase family protein [Microbacterium aoyamense]|uniref:propanoyl-CoA C-acyltransferase n=2 Tax=Microbacterium aoyamense TaxID=344166 RepID=A0ABN2PBZ4_9MICO
MSEALATLAGVGTSAFGKQSYDAQTLMWQAISEALIAAECAAADIDAIFVGNVFNHAGTAQRGLLAAGFAGQPVFNVENTCASGTLAVHLAVQAVHRGDYRRVLAVGYEKMTDTIRGPLPTDPRDADAAAGLILPAVYAMTARRYMSLYGVTAEQLATVSVKNHLNALQNDRAQYSGDFTVAEILDSRPIADPLTLLQCSPISDGAGAVVVTAEDVGAAGAKVLSSALASARPWPTGPDQVWNYELIERTTNESLAQASISRSDIDVIELHDAFTIGELVTLEAMGFFKPGTAGPATEAGETAVGGRLPVNVSGGLLSRGHPLGATGLAQIAEIAWQVQGQAGARQLDRADIGLIETMGGNVAGLTGNGCVVMTLAGGKQ